MSKEMEEIGFVKLIDAPKGLLGQEVTLLHWSGATENVTFETVDEAFETLMNGWTRYRPSSPAKQKQEAA